MLSISPYGHDGPYRDYVGSDLTLIHGGGLAWICPDIPPPPERPPLRPFGRHALVQAGLHGAVAAMAACYGAAHSGVGEHIDLSVWEVVCTLLGRHFISYTYPGEEESRFSTYLTAPATFFPCRDGTIYLLAVEQDQWERLVALMGHPAWADDPAFGSTTLRGVPDTLALINRRVAEWSASWSVDGLFHACQARRIGAAPVFTPAGLEGEAHLQARGFFQPCAHPVAGRLLYPGAPYKLERPWWALRAPAPLLGEAGRQDGGADAAPAALFPADRPPVETTVSAPPEGNGAPAPPLAGVRVLDLSWVWAGPHASQLLAFLGAEVIKVESSRRPDLARRLNLFAPGMEPGPDRNGYFNQVGQGKRSVAIDLSHPEGLELIKGLAAASDVVLSNFATGVMERLRLGTEVLQAIRPDLIIATISAFGQTGPYRNYTGYGPAITPLSGLARSTGYEEDGLPQNVRSAYADPNAGAYLAFAILAALEARRRRGGGQVIDVSLWEALICTGFEGWMGHVLGHPAPAPMGNRDPVYAPHNLYRCMGADAWVAVAVTDDRQWPALCAVLERPDLRDDPRFRTAAGRKERETLMDEILQDWCAVRDKWTVTAALQAAGVPAFPSLSNRELSENAHLSGRGFLVRQSHPQVGVRTHIGIPWRTSLRPNRPPQRAPLLGEHTDAVLHGLLHLSAGEIRRLRAAGAIE
jgi:crotonobetainyl-CoA:carnitine CoA-transferase CaiB-like acyl-CoA transferase